MGTQGKRARRKERNRQQAKARSNAIRINRVKQYGVYLVIAAALIGVIALAVMALPDLDPNTTPLHGG